MMNRELIILTCDDGIDSSLLQQFYNELSLQNKVNIIATEKDISGTSSSVTINKDLKLKKIYKDKYVTNGYVADCVALGCLFKKNNSPEYVISGINQGLNVGLDTNYSGTFAGAVEGIIQGKKAMAFSAEGFKKITEREVVKIACDLFEKNKERLKKDILYNVNIPDCRLNKIKGIKITKLSNRVTKTVAIKTLAAKNVYNIKFKKIKQKEILENETDYQAIKEKYISITPIKLNNTYGEIDNIKKDFGILGKV